MYDIVKCGGQMRKLIFVLVAVVMIAGCSSPVRFIQTDETYVPAAKPKDAEIVFRHDKIMRPHQVIGVIEAVLDKRARRPELDALIIKKAREIGADGVMLVEYDVDRNVYLETHHAVVGRGPWKRHVVGRVPRVDVKKTATAIAVIFQ
jgi:hypothetical protein